MRVLLSLIFLVNFYVVQAAAKKLPESILEIQLSFSKTVKKVAPAVVNVYSTKIVAGRQSPFSNDPFFRQFFGNRFGSFGNRPSREVNSLGSGVIVDSSGIVVTNQHVIKDASSVRIVLTDGTEFDAEIILEDERSDLAILRLIGNGATFNYIEFANSDEVEVGDLALAIGNPFGVGQTVTSGIVSAVARSNVGISDSQFFIQTDAAINPGNSGGALVDSIGRLIGVNTAIYSRSGGSNGIGFAIPANMVRRVVESAKTGNRVLRPWVGVNLQSVTGEIAASIGLTQTQGVMVLTGLASSPLFAAGIARGDVVTAIDGVAVKNEDHFRYLLANKKIGILTTFSVLRDEQFLEFDVQLIGAPEEPPRRTVLVAGRGPFNGAEITNISPAVVEEMSLPLGSVGVIISYIKPNSPAHRYGLKIGDVIIQIAAVAINEVSDLVAENLEPRRYWQLTINRGGRIINSTLGG